MFISFGGENHEGNVLITYLKRLMAISFEILFKHLPFALQNCH
jgi:hypothetical protein